MTIDETTDLPLRQGAILRRAAVLALLCVGLAVLAVSDVVHVALDALLTAGEEIITRHPVLGTVLFVLFAAISAMLAFVSVAIVVPVAVVTWGEPFSLLLLWLGWILGGMLAYGIGRLPGRALVRWMAAGAALGRMERRIGRHAPFALVLLLQLALPSELPGYLLGLVRYDFRRFLLALGLAELPYTIATIYLSAGFVEQRSGLILMVGLPMILLSVVALAMLRRRLAHSAQSPQ